MQLYFSPLSCSLASRITAYETAAAVDLVEVDPTTKRTSTGADYREIHPLGLVPTLVADDGARLTENVAVLLYLADRAPAAALAPRDGLARTRLVQWLSFIATELHKSFAPLFDPAAPDAVQAYQRARLAPRLAHVDAHLAGQPWLVDGYSVADAYLFAILNWTQVTAIPLADYPALAAFHRRALERPAVARAFAEERALYLAERARAS